eukprot:COSAG03_NODE_3575_length_1942_cov_1.728703_1_plen_337_part_10
MFATTGSFLFPSVHELWRGGDMREVVAVVGMMVLILHQCLNLATLRRACRPKLLSSIGIGRDRISRAQYDELAKARKAFHAYSTKCFVHPAQNLVQLVLVSWFCVWGGKGASTALVNRISGVFFVHMTIFSGCVFQSSCVVPLKAGCVVVSNKVSAVSSALKSRPSAEQWNAQVARPAAQLVEDMGKLSELASPVLTVSAVGILNLQATFILLVTSDLVYHLSLSFSLSASSRSSERHSTERPCVCVCVCVEERERGSFAGTGIGAFCAVPGANPRGSWCGPSSSGENCPPRAVQYKHILPLLNQSFSGCGSSTLAVSPLSSTISTPAVTGGKSGTM